MDQACCSADDTLHPIMLNPLAGCAKRAPPSAEKFHVAEHFWSLVAEQVFTLVLSKVVVSREEARLPVIMVVEDDYDLQGIVEDALIEGGFEAQILSSGEEALTLFRGGLKNYKVLVTDVGLKGRLNGWEIA